MIKTFFMTRIGPNGFTHMLQIGIYTALSILLHIAIAPDPALLPVALAAGIISFQSTITVTKRVSVRVWVMFAISCCMIAFISLIAPQTLLVYLIMMVVTLLLINFFMPQKYLVMVMVVATALFFMTDENFPKYILMIFVIVDVFINLLLVRVITHYVHIPIEKSLHNLLISMLRQYNRIFESFADTSTQEDFSPTLYTLYNQFQLLLHEYQDGKHANPNTITFYQDLLKHFEILYFHIETITTQTLTPSVVQAFHTLANNDAPSITDFNDTQSVLGWHMSQLISQWQQVQIAMQKERDLDA